MRLLLCMIIACSVSRSPSFSQPAETYEYKKNGKDIRFEKGDQAISLVWKKKTKANPKELDYYGPSQNYRLIFKGAHPTHLYRGEEVVVEFKDQDIHINNKIYHYGEGIREHWVFMMKDTIVVDCRYEEPDDKRLINIRYSGIPEEDVEILKILALKRGNEVARPRRSNIALLIGTGVAVGLTTVLIMTNRVDH